MDNYSKVLTFFMENGITLNKEQLEAIKEGFLSNLFKKKSNPEDEAEKNKNGINRNIKDAYEYWTNLCTQKTWEGDALETLYCLGISENDIAKHFANHEKLCSLSEILEYLDGEDHSEENDKLPSGMSLDDKCLEVYSNDDNIVIYDYKIKKYVDIDIDIKFTMVNNLYKEYLYNIDDYDNEDKKQYQDAARELGLNFKI